PSSSDVWQTLPQAEIGTLPARSLSGAVREGIDAHGPLAGNQHGRPSNVLPIRPQLALADFSTNPLVEGTLDEATLNESHVAAFVCDRLQISKGSSVAASDLRATYERWCAARGRTPLTSPRFAAELKRLGFAKWKSCGLIRYRDLQLAA